MKKTQKKREEVVDLWTRLHVTLRDTDPDPENGAEDSAKCAKGKDDATVMKLQVSISKQFELSFHIRKISPNYTCN